MRKVETKQKYNRLTIVKEARRKGTSIIYLCLCYCGNYCEIYRGNLITGKSKSCGCYKKEEAQKRLKKTNKYYIENNIAYVTAENTNNIFMVDADKWEQIKNICWYEGNNGYLQNKSADGLLLLHRVVTSAEKGLVVDHINHNKRDNRLINLRVCDYSENAINKKDLPKGISQIYDHNNIYYVVQLKGRSKSNYRGCFTDYEEAKKLRDKIIKEEYVF